MSNNSTPTQPNPKKYTKNGSLSHGPERVKVPTIYVKMWCRVDALFSNHLFFLQKPHANLQFLMILLALLTASTLTLRNQERQTIKIHEKNYWPVLEHSLKWKWTYPFFSKVPNTKSRVVNLWWRIHPNKAGQKSCLSCLTTKVIRPVLSKHESKKMKTFNPQLQPEFLVTASKPCQRPTVSSQKPGSKPCILD